MAQYELSLRDYWRVVRKRRWIIIIIIVLVSVITFIYSTFQSHVYQATATVHYKEQRLLATMLSELIYQPIGDIMLSQAKLIEGYNVAELAAKSLGWVKADMPKKEEIRIISSIQAAVDAKVVPNTDSIDIIVQHSDPQKAAEIANAMAYAYKDYNLIEKSSQATNLRETVEKQLSQVRIELGNAEAALQKFKEENKEVTGTALPAYSRYDSLKKEEETLLRKYTIKHPDVIRIRQELEVLEKELARYPEKEIVLSRLIRDNTINSGLYADYKQQLERAKIAEGEKTPDVRFDNPAWPPSSPIRPDKVTNQLIGLILGIIISLSLAFIIEHLDTSIGTIEEIEQLVQLPVLGVIPYLSPEKSGPEKQHSKHHKKDFWLSATDFLLDTFYTPLFKENSKSPSGEGMSKQDFYIKSEKSISETERVRTQLIWNYSPTSPLFESYRTLRTNLVRSANKPGAENAAQPILPDESNKVIAITSTGPQEGKTITASNLAITMALQGGMVLLVDMDMRKPLVHKIFGLERENGLSDILIGIKKLDACVHNITDMLVGGIKFDVIVNTPGIDNLHVITAGTAVPNPSELLTRGMSELFSQLRKRYQYIICDCPPVLAVADVLVLGPKTDLTALVYRAGKTAKGALLRAKEQITSSHINLKGLILNYVTPEIEVSPTYYYNYYRYYPSDKEPKEPAAKV
ncbi:MAG: polysaccharide biosynthesis tyrosine autokinase [Planctomycetes bacterium]|nr:polysaccharide biosynthesis tyrosine autokinase [Planctomycetota bacterium]